MVQNRNFSGSFKYTYLYTKYGSLSGILLWLSIGAFNVGDTYIIMVIKESHHELKVSTVNDGFPD